MTQLEIAFLFLLASLAGWYATDLFRWLLRRFQR
jgi:hypothetical protein